MSVLESRPVTELTSGQLVEIMNLGFEDYILPARFQVPSFEARMGREHLDRNVSQVFYLDGQPAGVVLVNRRGWHSRIGAMGVAKAFRGKGYGGQMLAGVLEAARLRADKSVVLEVFEENHSAVALYTKLGFKVVRRLVGYSKTTESGAAKVLKKIDSLEFARRVAQEGEPNLPWMLAPETFAGYTEATAYSLDDRAFALVQDTPGQSFVLWGLLVPKSLRGQGWGRQMVMTLLSQLAGKNAQVVQIVPEGLAPEFFAHMGFVKTQLNQFEMRLEL